MESRKGPRQWWKEDEAGAEAEKVALGAGGPSGRRTRRTVISARWRRIRPARRHMVLAGGPLGMGAEIGTGTTILSSR